MTGWLVVVLAGAVGAVVRDVVTRHAGSGRPRLGTWTVNVLGSFALGLAVGAALDPVVERTLGLGLLGGLTTFSTWMIEATDPRASRRVQVLELTGQLVAGLAAAAGGLAVGAALGP